MSGPAQMRQAVPGPAGVRRSAPPRVLLVDTSLAGLTQPCGAWDDVIDYAAVEHVPRGVRWLERISRLDFSLAHTVLEDADGFDLLVAGSEKVGIPLSLRKSPRPLICIVHQIASPMKRALLKSLDIPRRWIRAGYQCNADRDLLMSYYGVPAHRLVKFKAAPLETFRPTDAMPGEYVLSVGSAQRDYETLFAALDDLQRVSTRVYASSRFLDPYRGTIPKASSALAEVRENVPSASMPAVYASARFVVLPMRRSYQYSAGTTAALEALAAGKAVVATDTPGLRDFVLDGVTGILVPGGDPAALRAAIERLWHDPQLAARMGMAGRAYVEREFNPVIVDAQIRRAYAEACDEFHASDVSGAFERAPRCDRPHHARQQGR